MNVKERTPGPPGTTRQHAAIADVMSRDPLTLRTTMRLEAAVLLLLDHGYTGAPVVNPSGALAGVLHAIDIATTHLPPRTPYPRRMLVGRLLRPAVTITPTQPVHVAAERLFTGATDRLVVVENGGAIVGLVTAHDMLRAVAQCGDLLQLVVDETLASLGLVTVSAHVGPNGVVLLAGAVDTPRTRRRLVAAVGATGGVTQVDDLLTVLGPDRS